MPRDIRFLYAKKVLITDNSEEVRLRGDLEIERTAKNTAQMQLGLMKYELGIQKNINEELQKKIEILQSRGITFDDGDNTQERAYETYKLFMEKNIEISKEAGCRVMLYGKKLESLIVSQKSAQNLFPGFGVRFLDAATFRLGQFLHVSSKSVRDLSLNLDEDRLITATMDKGAKLFDINNRTVINVFTPSDTVLWACAFERDSNKSNFLYLGTNQTYVYDTRNPQNFIREFQTEGE
jgi:E3 ubiquitin-protein ligase RFWD3